MRVGINFGNALLAGKDPATGSAVGIAVDLAREMGRMLHAEVELIAYESAGTMADAARTGAWDAAFLAADPARAAHITFTEPYLEIEATYLVPAGSPLRTPADVDRPQVRIAVSDKSAYDLALRRSIQHAEIVRAPNVDASVDLFLSQRLDALAGLKPLLVNVASRHPGARVLDGRFAAVQQAIGTPKERDAAGLDEFVRFAKTSGLVAGLIEKHRVQGVIVAG